MSMTPEIIIEKNWQAVKKEMHKTWRNLTEEQIGKIENYDDLVAALKKAYNITDDEKIIDKINKFIDKFDLTADLTLLEEFKNALFDKAIDAKESIENAIKVSTDTVKEKTSDWSNQALAYSKENPLKMLGLGVVTALVIKKMLHK